jgi:FAD/FMN-containing dehydrogenase
MEVRDFMIEVKNKLVKITGPDRVYDDAETLKSYVKDLSGLPAGRPDFVVRPLKLEEVEQIVHLCNEEKIPLIPVSSRSPGLRGASMPSSGGIIIDLSSMDKIIRIDRKNRIAMIEPGVTFEQLLPELDKGGLRLSMPLLPDPEKSVLAWALEREPAIMPRYHWDIADPLACMEVVFGNGDTLRTGEAAGPGSLEEQWERGGAQKFPLGPHQIDYHRLVQGSQGTFGIATWATIKCELKPTIQKCFFVSADKIEDLTDFAYKMIKLDLADELFIVNNVALASILSTEPDKIKEMYKTLPTWILTFAIAGLDYFPEERIAYRSHDVYENAKASGIEVTENLPGIEGDDFLKIISMPSEEPYWKLRYKGGCRELFFTHTLDNAAKFIHSFIPLAEKYKFPAENTGIYLQPLVQGTSCHIEFDMFYDPEDKKESAKVNELHSAAVNSMMNQGGFFNRPYPSIANQVFDHYPEHTTAIRQLKEIFDPNMILNPGKLCF